MASMYLGPEIRPWCGPSRGRSVSCQPFPHRDTINEMKWLGNRGRPVGMSVGPKKLILSLGELSGHIWLSTVTP
jgi:hypothetical protein